MTTLSSRTSVHQLSGFTRLSQISHEQRAQFAQDFGQFLDAATTATARGSFYNSKETHAVVVNGIHQKLFDFDRGIYAAALALPGMTDYNRQIGLVRLLATTRNGSGLLPVDFESKLVEKLSRELPPQRMLKLLGMLRAARVNNSRSRRLAMRLIIGSNSLEFWSTKYRRKIASALKHAWGQRTAGILISILHKSPEMRNEKERRIVATHIDRYCSQTSRSDVYQCIRFVFGDESGLSLPRLISYRDAKEDFSRGKTLPPETLEGIRSRFHKEIAKDEVLRLTKRQMTSGQQIATQRQAKEAGIEINFDPSRYDAIRLYLYAFAMGMTNEIQTELSNKAIEVSKRLQTDLGRVGILLDVSGSMFGDTAQPLRPMAAALALRDVLSTSASDAFIVTTADEDVMPFELVKPSGDTSLAKGLVRLLKSEPDAVFVLTDGYENAPAGRFSQVVRAVRQLGNQTPIYQFSPVFAAEAGGIRRLSQQVQSLPFGKPDSIGLALLKALIESDLDRGIAKLLSMSLPKIDNG